MYLVVNKAEGLRRDMAGAEFHELALGEPWRFGAHGDGVRELIEDARALPRRQRGRRRPPASQIAVIGWPNVGKSTWSTPFWAKSG